MNKIYNFCIIAHIDHGKSTLADRMLELTHTVDKRHMKAQLLDSMELEREKGITIKLQPVRMKWGGDILNLIDTPGHVDFQYEVSRSLQAVEAAVLLVDASQGVQAQTLANLYLALEQDLEIIPVLNKIDLPAADVPKVTQEILKILGGKAEDILQISAKTGQGVEQVLDAIRARVKSATTDEAGDLRALIFDSSYDDYKGVVAYVRVMQGTIKARDHISFLGTSVSDKAVEVGTFAPGWNPAKELAAGEIGYIATGLKDVRSARVGDTVTLASSKTKVEALPGFAIPQPKVYAGIFPRQGDDFVSLRAAMDQLALNDASLQITEERNEALGQGFRCGFLGMLHLEIIQQRLQREFDLELVVTAPSVAYKIWLTSGKELEITTPAQFPDPSHIDYIKERYAHLTVLTPTAHLGAVFELMQEHEGELQNQDHLEADRVSLHYYVPMREIVVDLYDQLKSVTSGYGSMSYELADWEAADVVKLTVLINHEPAEALSLIVARKQAESTGRRIVSKLKEVIPKQLFAIPVQAAVGGNVVARETLSAMRKDVTAGLYGGDYSRKRKVLEKQKKGKAKMAKGGRVEIPADAYLAIFKK